VPACTLGSPAVPQSDSGHAQPFTHVKQSPIAPYPAPAPETDEIGALEAIRQSNHLPNYRESGVEVNCSEYRWVKGNKVTKPFRASWGVSDLEMPVFWKIQYFRGFFAIIWTFFQTPSDFFSLTPQLALNGFVTLLPLAQRYFEPSTSTPVSR